MAEDQTPHARHSPPESPPTEFEAFYPTGDIVAAAQDRNQAESVAQALTGLGLPATDMDILDPTFVIQAAEELKRRRGILGRLGALFGDDSYFAAQFVELARKGHPLLLIHVSDRETAKQVGVILKESRRAHRQLLRTNDDYRSLSGPECRSLMCSVTEQEPTR